MDSKPHRRRSIGVRDLRKKLASTLYRVRADQEPIYITNHGRPIAVITPITERDVDVEL